MKIIFKNKGFTLIELLVVISIIGILVTVGLVNYNNAKKSSRDAKRMSDLESMASAMEIYYSQNKDYPYPTASTDQERFKALNEELITDGNMNSYVTDPKNNEVFYYGYTQEERSDEYEGIYLILYVRLENDKAKNTFTGKWQPTSETEDSFAGSGVLDDSASGYKMYRIVIKAS